MNPKIAHAPDWKALLAGQPELRLLTTDELDVARITELPRDAQLFRRGETPRKIHCLLSGEIHLVRYSRRGAAMIVARSRDGFIAEASLDAPRYHCDALVVADAVVLSLPLAAYRDALDRNTAFRRARFAAQAREIRRLRAQGERLALPTAEERLTHYIETEGSDGSIELDRPLKALAVELNLTHEALYRTLARMAQAGRIERTAKVLRLR
ncbi:MAG: Crp/Fnr family transcriptional regulator [Sulfuritalea sp.]|jgi:CRP-like cAMP-binding protein|nr:Crp/Fnr family transcriptional regulator [Sulfuritalea sp.]